MNRFKTYRRQAALGVALVVVTASMTACGSFDVKSSKDTVECANLAGTTVPDKAADATCQGGAIAKIGVDEAKCTNGDAYFVVKSTGTGDDYTFAGKPGGKWAAVSGGATAEEVACK